MISAVLLFIAVIGILVLVHELGHFFAAKRSGARVEEFGIGFPPRIFGVRRGETLYSLNLFPIGGFVKIYGEGGEDRENPKSFSSKPIWVRALIIGAGVIMNFALAVGVYSVGYATTGLPQGVDENTQGTVREASVYITSILEDSAAQDAGIEAGDRLVKFVLDGEEFETTSAADVIVFVKEHSDEEFTAILERNGVRVQKTLTPQLENGRPLIGISMVGAGIVSFPWYESIWRGTERAAGELIGILYLFSSLIAQGDGESLAEGVAGPVGIAKITQDVARIGFPYFLAFLGLISLNLALINAVPFPALDGGRLLFLGIEKVKGSPVDKRLEGIAHAVGFAILIGLVILITFRDVQRLL